MLRRIEKINGKPKKQTPPITPFKLRQIHKVLDFKSKFELTMWALFLTSFFLMLRKSNVTPASQKDWEKIPKRSDFVRGASGYVVSIRCTKALQNNSGILEHPLLLNSRNILCPVSALDRMFHLIQVPRHCPAFCSPSGKSIIRHTIISSRT